MPSSSETRIFGIRHHGPGSARSLLAALREWEPDVVLIEGPPDAEALLPLAADPFMEPPVALLVYDKDAPKHGVFYPFATFSPEWQAMQWAMAAGVPVRFMDLPQWHRLALDDVMRGAMAEEADRLVAEEEAAADAEAAGEELPPEGDREPGVLDAQPDDAGDAAAMLYGMPVAQLRADPLMLLAREAGYTDSERWWDALVEQRRDSTAVFEAILEAMTELRQALAILEPPTSELYREAWMRKTLRQAEKEGFARIAVVCGALHAPALRNIGPAKHDNALLKGLPKVKTMATWVPWTHGRLAMRSGYGAGVESPGWYEHVWNAKQVSDLATGWLTTVAMLLREQDLDASSAQVIDAVRLAEALAAMRARPAPGLPELNEATLAVLCGGQETMLRLVRERLVVGERLGGVPASAPSTPLQQDLEGLQKRLRMKPEAAAKTIDLDLRKPMDLERSYLLHRLLILGLPWGERQEQGGAMGTFHEWWELEWDPEFAITVVEAGTWGNTVMEAATAKARDRAEHGGGASLARLTSLLEQVLLADLPDAMGPLMARLERESALSADVASMMEALPPLASVLRYGNVRQTDTTMVEHYVNGLVTRLCTGLPNVCASLNADASADMLRRVNAVNQALALLRVEAHLELWQGTLRRLLDLDTLHGLLRGRACRLLLDAELIDADAAVGRMRLALALATDPADGAAWLEGFLQGSGMLLLYDDRLWQTLDEWLNGLSPDAFDTLLPLMRRTFSTFPAGERRQFGERVRREGEAGLGAGGARSTGAASGAVGAGGAGLLGDAEVLDHARAVAVLPLLATLLAPPPAAAGAAGAAETTAKSLTSSSSSTSSSSTSTETGR